MLVSFFVDPKRCFRITIPRHDTALWLISLVASTARSFSTGFHLVFFAWSGLDCLEWLGVAWSGLDSKPKVSSNLAGIPFAGGGIARSISFVFDVQPAREYPRHRERTLLKAPGRVANCWPLTALRQYDVRNRQESYLRRPAETHRDGRRSTKKASCQIRNRARGLVDLQFD